MTSRAARTVGLTLLGIAPLVLIGSGADAFWTESATGSGSAGTAGSVAVTLTPGTPTTALLPGATADVAVTVTNSNPVSLSIGSLSLDPGHGTGGYAVDPGHAGCDVSSLSFSPQSNGGAGWTVPGQVGGVDGTLSLTLTDAVGLDVDAANDCQGATFSVYLRAGP